MIKNHLMIITTVKIHLQRINTHRKLLSTTGVATCVMGDILFSKIESWHGSAPWGKFLDAGTGVHSLKWIQKLNTESWTAITADHGMKRSCESAGINIRPVDKLVVGNWMDDEFCESLGKFDTILADYLIGAVDGFSPYTQDLILHRCVHTVPASLTHSPTIPCATCLSRLRERLTSNGKLYIVGMEPIPDSAVPPADIICEVSSVSKSG